MSQSVKLSRFLFNTQDGTLNEDAKLACQCLHIPAEKLIPKTLQDFKDGKVSEEIAAMRLQYYEDKRRVFTKQVEETIRSGIIEDVKQEFRPIMRNPTALNRTAGSLGRDKQIYGEMGEQPRTVLSKNAMGFVQDYGANAPASTLPPEITLRDPLDQEFVLNRKMAKKYYEEQLRERMQENQMKKQEEREKKNKELTDREAKKDKTIMELNLTNKKILQGTIKERLTMEQERKQQRDQKQRETAIKILRGARQEERERQARVEKKQQDYNTKLEEAFERDKRNREYAEQKGNQAAVREQAMEKDLTMRLMQTEQTLLNKQELKQAQLREIQARAAERAERRLEQARRLEEERAEKELKRLGQYVEKVNKVQQKRTTVQKDLKAQFVDPNKVPTHVRLAEIQKMKEDQQKEQARKIRNGIRQREKQVDRNMSYLKEENERRKEVKNLHKIDQEDNLQRKKAFERMGLENRVQMILEKGSRVQKPLV